MTEACSVKVKEWERERYGEALALLSTVNTLVMLIISSLSCHGWMTKEGGSFSCRGIKGRRMDEPARGAEDGCFQLKGPFYLSFICYCKSKVARCIDKQILPFFFFFIIHALARVPARSLIICQV